MLGAATTLTSLSALSSATQAEAAAAWREYRNDEMGFRVGNPTVRRFLDSLTLLRGDR